MTPLPAQIRSRGHWAEDLALAYLEGRGLRSVQRNYRCRGGELDIVCLHARALVFVEVRYRRTNALVSAAESITATKRKRLRLAAAHFLSTHKEHGQRHCRFDVVTVTGAGDGDDIRWIRDAFQD